MPENERDKPVGRSGNESDNGQGASSESSDRLESWKEIAEFLNKGVRTVMRWEELGLPVHRIPGAKRGRIVASRAEIRQWLAGQSGLETGQERGAEDTGGEDSAAEIPAAAPAVEGSRAVSRWAVYLGAAVICSMAALFLYVSIRRREPSHGVPDHVSFFEDKMDVLDANGQVIWTHKFSGPVDRNAILTSKGLRDFARIGDLSGDGRRELVVALPVRSGPNPEPRHGEVDCFSETGTPLWSYIPHETYQFGDRPFSGPWIPYRITVSRGGPAHSIFVAFDQTPWGYSFVTEIDSKSGTGKVRFVNSGSLFGLDEIKTSSAAYLLTGGFNNEFDGGSLAVLNERRAFGASPQTPNTHNACMNCPEGGPDYYLVFPRSEINKLRRVYNNPVTGITVDGNQIEITKLELLPDTNVGMRYLFQMDPALHMLSLRYDSMYDMLHRELEQKGELDHPLSRCPERLHPAPVRVWTPSDGWKDWTVKPIEP